MKSRIFISFILIFSSLAWGGSDEAKSVLPLPTSGNVTLPLVEYDRLVDLARKAAKKGELPPVAYALKHADLKLKVANDAVLGSMVLDGEVFGKGPTKVPLASGMTILNANQQGKPLPLEEEGATSTAVLSGPAEFSVSLDTGIPLGIEAGRASFILPAPTAGSVRLTLVIPGDHSNVRISQGLIIGRTSDHGQTTIEAALEPGQRANIWWQTREIATPIVPKEVRFLSDVKTLVSVSETDLRIAALADITVVQGDPTQFTVAIPEGYEITGASGATVESSETQPGALVLKLSSSAPRTHQFLITMERPLSDSKAEAPFISFKDTQRETGEVLVEGAGAMELTAKEAGGLKRMDVKEVNPYLRSLARFPLQAAFRFHRQPNETPALALEWTRFPDSSVLAAVAEHAVVTTLVTSEGRSLTEVKLTIKNQAQPFLKVDLPQGATILSAEVAGEKVKPVQGPDGNRVPLLRAGFRPTDAYEVSFVFMHSGAPFAKKGGSELDLPSMDVPISLLDWEVFLPEQYKVRDFGGDAIAANLLEAQPIIFAGGGVGYGAGTVNGYTTLGSINAPVYRALLPGQLGGFVIDPSGAVIPGATVTVTNVASGASTQATSDSNGRWVVSNVTPGPVKIAASAQGFSTVVYNSTHAGNRSQEFDFRMPVGSLSQTVEVTGEQQIIELPLNGRNFTTLQQLPPGATNYTVNGADNNDTTLKQHDEKKKDQNQMQQNASANVFNLQKKVAGVLPVRVDVPRAGNSYRFARTLVLDEETKITFAYKTK